MPTGCLSVTSGKSCACHSKYAYQSFKVTHTYQSYLSNRHTCCTLAKSKSDKSSSNKAEFENRSCTDKNGVCKACFPRETHPETIVDPKTGALIMNEEGRGLDQYCDSNLDLSHALQYRYNQFTLWHCH